MWLNSSSAASCWTFDKWTLLPDLQLSRLKWTQCLPQEVAMRIKVDNMCQAYSSANNGSQAPYFPYLICNNCISACVSWILWSFKSSIIYPLRCWCLISLITGKKPDHPTPASAECPVHSKCSIYTHRLRECLWCVFTAIEWAHLALFP